MMDYKKVHDSYLDLVNNYRDELIDTCNNNHQVCDHNMHESLIYNLMTLASNHKYTRDLSELEMIGLLLAGYCYYMNFEINETI
jgi:hypothetical protein